MNDRLIRPSFCSPSIRRTVTVGDVKLGSEHPIVRQTMTTSDTRDVEATVAEVRLRTDPPLDVLLPLIPKEYRRQIIHVEPARAICRSPRARPSTFIPLTTNTPLHLSSRRR